MLTHKENTEVVVVQDEVNPRAVLAQLTSALRVYVSSQHSKQMHGSALADDADRAAWREKVKRARLAKMANIQAALRGDSPAPQRPAAPEQPRQPQARPAPEAPAPAPAPQGAAEDVTGPGVRFNSAQSAATGGVPDAIRTTGPMPWKTVGSRPQPTRVQTTPTRDVYPSEEPASTQSRASKTSKRGSGSSKTRQKTKKPAQRPAQTSNAAPAYEEMGYPEESMPSYLNDGPPPIDDAPPIGMSPRGSASSDPPKSSPRSSSTPSSRPTRATSATTGPAAARHDVPARPPTANTATTPDRNMDDQRQTALAGGAWTKPEHALKGYDDTPALEKKIDELSRDEKLMFLRQCLGDCQRCNLSDKRTNIVFGDGSARAEIVFVGEGPGYHEDKQGIPFVGDSGQLLNKMINAMGLHREDIYIANVVKCRPPKNRDPAPDEIRKCSPFLYKQLETIQPKAIITLGRFASQCLLDTTRSMGSMRGRWHEWRDIPVMPTYHPAYLLRSPQQKRKAWEDLQKVMQKLGIGE